MLLVLHNKQQTRYKSKEKVIEKLKIYVINKWFSKEVLALPPIYVQKCINEILFLYKNDSSKYIEFLGRKFLQATYSIINCGSCWVWQHSSLQGKVVWTTHKCNLNTDWKIHHRGIISYYRLPLFWIVGGFKDVVHWK